MNKIKTPQSRPFSACFHAKKSPARICWTAFRPCLKSGLGLCAVAIFQYRKLTLWVGKASAPDKIAYNKIRYSVNGRNTKTPGLAEIFVVYSFNTLPAYFCRIYVNSFALACRRSAIAGYEPFIACIPAWDINSQTSDTEGFISDTVA